jgi:hypothetical protein
MGEPYCCEQRCDHVDCNTIREHAEVGCPHCTTPLTRGDAYTYVVPDPHRAERIAHFECAQKQYVEALTAAAAR